MKVYQFIFLVGLLNLIIPFFGVTYIYKNYAIVTLAIVTLAYALILRTIEHERRMLKDRRAEDIKTKERTIEQVVEMESEHSITNIKPRTVRKKAVVIKGQVHE